MNIEDVVRVLRDLDSDMVRKDEEGFAEEPWWYFRTDVARALGVPESALDSQSGGPA